MTIENRVLIDLAEIAGIEVECRECSAKVLYPIEKNHERIGRQCPNCNGNLFTLTRTTSGEGSVSIEQIKLLMRVLKFLAHPETEQGANVRLQVKQLK